MKNKSQIVTLTIAVIIGFTCAFTTFYVHGKVTNLDFEAVEVASGFMPIEEWVEDGVYHLRFYKTNTLTGTIDGIPFTGNNEGYMHLKVDLATGEMILHATATFYITWGDKVGTFHGPVNVKGLPMEPFYGKFTCQGGGDFKGWKLFGELWQIDGMANGLSGTILIPK